MPGFDWNGNGKSDAFDNFMDMEVASSTSDDIDEMNTDTDISDNADGEIDYHRAAVANSLRNAYNSTKASGTQKMSFQDELKKNIRTPEAVEQEEMERERSFAIFEAERALDKIKELLLSQVKHADYETRNGVTSVSATYAINQLYLKPEWRSNSAQLQANKDTFFLFRDSNLKYVSGFCYDIKDDYKRRYDFFITTLRQLAAKENISIQIVLVTDKGIVPFPNTSTPIEGYAKLSVKATTIISVDQNYNHYSTVAQTLANTTLSSEEKTTQKNSTEDDGTVGKSLLVIGLVLFAFLLCFVAEFGEIGMAILLIGVAILGYKIFK